MKNEFVDAAEEVYFAEATGAKTILLGSDHSHGIEFYKKDALKIIALITKAAA